jgi:hypothetical protein
MVERVLATYAGHFGNFGVFGLPVREKAIHASLILSASAAACGPPPVGPGTFDVLSNTNEISSA